MPIHEGASILIVDRDTPGLEVVRNVAVGMREEIGSGVHGYLRFRDCRVPESHLLGKPGQGFDVAQSRLGGGRIHHAMRTVGVLKRALDMMCERALSRRTKGELLADKQLTQEKIADSYIQITQFRLHVLYAAWLIDQHKAYTREVRREIAAVKSAMQAVLRDVVYRALHLHARARPSSPRSADTQASAVSAKQSIWRLPHKRAPSAAASAASDASANRPRTSQGVRQADRHRDHELALAGGA